MNFLAHIYLSGDSTDIMIGNFIGDFVKGNDYLKYPENIRKGILLHRKIDAFTDKHPVTSFCKTFIKPKYKKFSGIVVDIFYDHFLATNWEQYSRVPLKDFVIQKYNVLCDYYDIFPVEVKKFFPYFLRNDWLNAYSTFDGLRLVLRRMAFRTSLPDFSSYAITRLKENYEVLGNNFKNFFAEVLEFVKKDFSIQPG
jgi:acyl carrier protein phosphodiesterase